MMMMMVMMMVVMLQTSSGYVANICMMATPKMVSEPRLQGVVSTVQYYTVQYSPY